MSSTGSYPGTNEIDEGIELISSLAELKSSFQFVDQFIAASTSLCDFEEEYEALENFYETQFTVWQGLERALNITFAQNRSFLDKSADAKQAIDKLEAIYINPRPYREIRTIKPLIEQVIKIDKEFVEKQREYTINKLKLRITEVETLVKEAGATAEISNQALLPFQSAKKRVEKENTVAQIKHELSESREWFKEAETLVNNYIRLQKELARKAKEEAEKAAKGSTNNTTSTTSATGTDGTSYPTGATTPVKVAEPAPIKAKETKSIDAMQVYNEVCEATYMETVDDVEKYISALRGKLTELVESNHKVRIQ